MRFWGRSTLANWTQVSDRCPLGYLLLYVRCKSGVTFIRRSFRDAVQFFNNLSVLFVYFEYKFYTKLVYKSVTLLWLS